MRKANIESNVYLIPQSWDDLMYTDAVKYYLAKCNDANPNEIITLLTGISEEILLNLSTNSVDKLFDELSFVNDESIFEDTNVKDEYKDFDFGSLKYRESEKVKQLIDYKKSLIENAPVLFDYLFKVDLDKEPFTEWIGTVNFFKQMGRFNDEFEHLSKHEQDAKQVQAGVDRLNRFGSFATYIELARSKVIGSTIEEVLEQPTRVVYMVLDYDKTKSEFEKDYNRILNMK